MRSLLLGELRWKAPQPAEDWEGVRKCYEYADMAMMRVHPGMMMIFIRRSCILWQRNIR